MISEQISAVLIVKNEEATLESCLKSLHGVDQIVVLDTGSTDRTVEIAKSFGAEVYTTDPIVPFHFAEARNKAMSYAKNDWCLSIDADEQLHAGSHKELRRAIKKHPDTTGINVTFIMKGELGDKKYPISKLKVFRKSYYTWKYRVHEMLVPTREFLITLNTQDVFIEHFPVSDKGPRHQQNLDLLKLCVEESPEYARARRQLGLEYMLRKDWDNAIHWLGAWYDHLDTFENDPLEKSHIETYLGQCFAEKKDLNMAIVWFRRACETAPYRRECPYLAAFNLMAHATKGEHVLMALECLDRVIYIPLSKRPKFHMELDYLWNPRDPKHKRIKEMADFCRSQVEEAKRLAALQK